MVVRRQRVNQICILPLNKFMCFVWISAQTAIIFLYSISSLVFKSREAVCLLCGTNWAFGSKWGLFHPSKSADMKRHGQCRTQPRVRLKISSPLLQRVGRWMAEEETSDSQVRFSHVTATLPEGTAPLTSWRRNYFFLILAHSVNKMWIIQEPNMLELWNKLHFEEKNTESICHV